MSQIFSTGGSGGGTSIGGAITGGTTGSVLFVGPGPVIAQDNANFFWDDATNNLLINKLSLPNTASSSVGGIYYGGVLFLSNYLAPTAIGSNLFLGVGAGNLTMGPGGGANYLGSYNVAIGGSALLSNTTGYYNNAIGVNALLSNTTGFSNNAIGVNAGYGITTGSNNTLLGDSSGTAASYNQVTTGSGNISIGNNVAVASPTASNQLCIGNLIYGTGLDGTGSTLSSGGISIGVTVPNANAVLDVVSTTKAFMPPRMTTTQKNAIASPTAGMLIYDSTLGYISEYNGTAWITLTTKDKIVFGIGDGTNVITTGASKCESIPYNCTIDSWTLLSDDPSTTSGAIVIDIWKDTYANYPPTVADTIVGGGGTKPTITATTAKGTGSPTGWASVTVTAGDVLRFNIDSVTSLTSVTLVLGVTKT